ncbi:AraC family transcriptional regulator [uncultured Alsobacter sp.]|uniref:helix-turn-helix transcriptional regulator n=1 Tax=uncultured Alsobacter sp. TaxID=1748258 RepID=UPI0025E9066E|nr:AraC family transcriptional regulator [uncultured Alsobacter sp.]
MEIFELHRQPDVVLPELQSLGWCHTLRPLFGGPRTDGRIAFEVGYLASGSIEWLTPAGLEEAGPGSVLIDKPGDWQGGVSAIVHPCERYWIRFNFPPVAALPGLKETTVTRLAAMFADMTVRHFPASQELRSHFDRLLHEQRTPGQFAEEIARACFHQILYCVALDYERGRSVQYSDPVQRSIRFMGRRLDRDCAVDEAARAVGLSVGYFHDLFLKEVGVTPARFHTRARVALAKRKLIDSDETVTDIAIGLGYSSSQYFATTFKRIVGLTPSDYRRLRDEHLGPRPAR